MTIIVPIKREHFLMISVCLVLCLFIYFCFDYTFVYLWRHDMLKVYKKYVNQLALMHFNQWTTNIMYFYI